MDEGRKRTILIAASILVARKLGHRFNPNCSAAGQAVFSLSDKQQSGAYVYRDATCAVVRAGGEDLINWCDMCFLKGEDGFRIGFSYMQEVTGLSRDKLYAMAEDFFGELSLQALS